MNRDNLEPVPPKIIQNAKWLVHYAWKHWPYVLIGAVLLFVGSGFLVPIVKEVWRQYSPLTTRPNNQRETGPKETNSLPQLKVTFSDGTVGLVHLAFSAQLVASELLRVHSTFGSSQKASEFLKNAVEAAAYSTFEAKTIDEVRQNRKLVADEIIRETTAAQQKSGYKILQLTISRIIAIRR